ncbi:MAG: DUF1295 domain-containing protein [Lachnospiraceae bacterium]|nr:DUF1295 domain-containing protein [Lachnospiraceae bacterium]
MKITESRSASYVILALIYIAAGVIGYLIYHFLPFSLWLNLLLADVAATVFVFLFSCIFHNASVYDPYWSVQPPVILTLFAIGQNITFAKMLLLVAVWCWAIRLTGNWAYTFHGLKEQDWRYTRYQNSMRRLYPLINFTGIHLVPTLIVYGCILPAVYAMISDVTGNIGSVLFFLCSLGAVLLELISDSQMHNFRKEQTGTFNRTGLWKYSRHPNYLGEICMWWSIGLAVFCVLPSYWYLLAGALANTILFLLVSIPLADGKQSAKEGFEDYKKETNMLVPVPRIVGNRSNRE